MNMDDKNSNQYKNVFDENGCMKCRDPNWRQKQLSVVTRRLDKLIQYIDFIKDERLLLYLTDSEKNDVIVKIHPVCQKTITNEMKRKGDTVPTTYKKNSQSSTMICDRVQLENSLFLLRIAVCSRS